MISDNLEHYLIMLIKLYCVLCACRIISLVLNNVRLYLDAREQAKFDYMDSQREKGEEQP